jgi:hypothetical protein
LSSEQHAATSNAELKVEAKRCEQEAVQKLNEGSLAVQREANKAMLATSIRETAAELRKKDLNLIVLQSIAMAKEALSEFL